MEAVHRTMTILLMELVEVVTNLCDMHILEEYLGLGST